MKLKSKHKYLHFFLGFIFAIFAYLQLNDPDPFLWTLGYLYVSFLALMNIFYPFSKTTKFSLIGGIILYVVFTAFFTPEFLSWIQIGMPSITGQMHAKSPYIEYTREFLGLVLCLVAVLYFYYQNKKLQLNRAK